MALRSKIAIITGASSGIGAGIAEWFAKEGAKLSLTGRNKERLDDVAQKCREHSSEGVITTVGDITDDNTRHILVQKTLDSFRQIDILVNNAGTGNRILAIDITPEQFDENININLRTPVLLSSIVAPHLIDSKGSILNISSSTSKISAPLMGLYAMTKAGLDLYTKVLARELGPLGVRVNSLNPGIILTPIFDTMAEPEVIYQILENARKVCPVGRHGTTEEMGKIAAFLVSDSASFITGQNVVADGGLWLMPGF